MSKQLYLLRHAEKDDQGKLTKLGKKQALQLKDKLPKFSKIISSKSVRVQETAFLLTGIRARIDPRAGFYIASPTMSNLLNNVSKKEKVSFLEAANKLNDPEVLAGIDAKAKELNNLINESIREMDDGDAVLIVSHDLSISPAMTQRGVSIKSIPFLGGFIINEENQIQQFNNQFDF